MSEKTPKVIWTDSVGLRLVAIPATKYPYDTIFVFENCQKDSLGFESWRQVERVTDANSPIWKFIDALMNAAGDSVIPVKVSG